MKWILLKDCAQDGAYNMALDAYFLENPSETPVLRLYSWAPPAVSLGYNQKIPGFNKRLFDHFGIDLVRRPTGGRAVYHCDEITYAVIIPKQCSLFALSIHGLYQEISRAIAAGLTRLGVAVEIERNKAVSRQYNAAQYECFESAARFEIKSASRKIVGSAQRRTADAVLQHGSILLADQQHILKHLFDAGNDKTYEIPNASEEKNSGKVIKDLSRDDIIIGLQRGFEKELECYWEEEIDLSHFFMTGQELKDRFIIYRAHSHALPELF